MERDHYREQLTGYDTATDYKKVLDQYNNALEHKDAEQVSKILTEQGGRFCLIWKVWYQEQRRNNGGQ